MDQRNNTQFRGTWILLDCLGYKVLHVSWSGYKCQNQIFMTFVTLKIKTCINLDWGWLLRFEHVGITTCQIKIDMFTTTFMKHKCFRHMKIIESWNKF